jgi:hypothetical protein
MLTHPVVFALYSVGALMALGTVAFSAFKIATNRRGPSGIPLSAISGRQTDWTPRLSRKMREFEQEIMELYQAEYMVGGT